MYRSVQGVYQHVHLPLSPPQGVKMETLLKRYHLYYRMHKHIDVCSLDTTKGERETNPVSIGDFLPPPH